MVVETLVSHPVTRFEFGVGTQAVQARACCAAGSFWWSRRSDNGDA